MRAPWDRYAEAAGATSADRGSGVPGFVARDRAVSFLPPSVGAGYAARADRHVGRRPPRILLLTSTLGAGHARAAQAIEGALRRAEPRVQVETLDFWALMDRQVAYGVRQTYLRLVHASPDLYDRIYRLDQRTWRRIVESSEAPPRELAEVLALMPGRSERCARAGEDRGRFPLDRLALPVLCAALAGWPRAWPRVNKLLRLPSVCWAWARLTARLEASQARFQPDAIVATQMNLNALLSSLKRRRRWRVPAVGVLTDFGLHDFWLQPGIDRYCVAHANIIGLAGAGVDAKRVLVTGIPLMPGFAQPPAAAQARAQLGLRADATVALVLGGGLGLGVEAAAERMLASFPEVNLLIMAGRNAAARASLAHLAARYGARVRTLGWTENMAVPMRASDIVVGKPGGLTVAEALACGRPLVATRSLGGQEGFNVRFLEAQQVGKLVTEPALVDYLRAVVTDREALARTQERALRLGACDGASRVAELTLALADAHRTQRVAA